MMLNNGLMTYKGKKLSFINKGVITLLLALLLMIILPFSYLVFVCWSEMPMIIKMFLPILLVIVLMAIIITPFNGMVIETNGNIFFVPDFRLKKFKLKDLERIAFVFNEWDNSKYSVMIKIVRKDGNVFIKDYSKQFRNIKNKKLAMSLYTITKKKVNKICNKLLDLDFCAITIVDKCRKIVYQNK